MSKVAESFYYDGQLKRYLIQFMSIFAEMQVQVGRNEDKSPRFITTPIYSASKDRVVASIKSDNTTNKPLRIPAMSAWMSNIDLAPEMRKGSGMERRNTFMPSGGLFPDDVTVVQQRMPVPYKAQFELSIWASNSDQMNQILEQILMVFNPQIQIQTSTEPFDWGKITQVELTGISNNENMEAGADRRILRQTLTFEIPIWVSIPATVHNQIVEEIHQRIGMVSGPSADPEEQLPDFDSSGDIPELNLCISIIDGGL